MDSEPQRDESRSERTAARRREFRAEFLRLWAGVPEHRTQTEIARDLGIHPSVISKYLNESADVVPSRATLIALARLLNTHVRLTDADATTTIRDGEFRTEEDEVRLLMALRRAERDPFRRSRLIRILSVLLEEMARPALRSNQEDRAEEPEAALTESEQIAMSVIQNLNATSNAPTPQHEPAREAPAPRPGRR